MSPTVRASLADVPRNRLFERWATGVLFFRWPILVACALFSAWMAGRVADGLRLDMRVDAFVPRTAPAATALEALRQDFGNDVGFEVVVEGDVLSLPFLRRLHDLQSDLETIQLNGKVPLSLAGARKMAASAAGGEAWGTRALPFLQVRSVLNASRLVADAQGVVFEPWLGDAPKAERLALVRDALLRDPTLAGHLVGEGGRHAVIRLSPIDLTQPERLSLYHAVDDVISLYEAKGFRPSLGGLLAIDAAVTEGVLGDQDFLLGAEAVVMLLVMWFIFRHPIGVLGPLLVVGQAALAMFGWMALSGVPQTLISAVLGALVLCLGTGFALHVQSSYRDARAGGYDSERAVVHALGVTGVPLLFTVLTTCAGLLSFLFARMEPIRQLGLAATTGVFFAGVFALTFLPAWLSLSRYSTLGASSRGGARLVNRLLTTCSWLTRGARWRRGLVLGATLSLAVAAAVGTWRVRPRHDPLDWLPADVPVAVATRALDRHVGGSAELALLITPREDGDLCDPVLLGAMDAFVHRALAFEPRDATSADIEGASSVLDRYRQAREALGIGRRGVPQTREQAIDLMTLWQQLAPERLHSHVTLDLRRALLTLSVRRRDAGGYAALTQEVARWVDQHLAPLADVQLTGAAYGTFTVVRSVLSDLLRSFAMAFIVITLLMWVLLRDVRLGLIATLPTLLPVLGMLGFMGFSGRPVDVQNVLLASIAAGVAVDGTLHFLHPFRLHFAGHGDVEAAIAHALCRVGPPVLRTSAALLAGFAVFGLGYMSSTRTFGVLASVAVGLSLLASLVVLPALLRTLYRSAPRTSVPARISSYEVRISGFS